MENLSFLQRLIFILMSVVLVDNFVLTKFLGVCPFLGVSKKVSPAVGMSIAVTFVMVLASAVTWPLYHIVLDGLDMLYLETVLFIVVIATLVQLVEITLKKYIPALHKTLGVYLPLITTNCAVLGVALLNIDESYGFVESVVNGLGAGVGFLIAMVMFSGVRERIEGNDIPESFKGMPIALVSAALVSMSFLGFAGLVDNLFAG